MKKKNLRRLPKQYKLSTVLALIASLFVIAAVAVRVNDQRSMDPGSKAAYTPNPLYPARNYILYEPPTWGTSGRMMTNAEIAQRFSVVVYARGQMSQYLAGYRNAGFTGEAMLYLIADVIRGPRNLMSKESQAKTCAENGITPSTSGYGQNHVTMDPGDFCRIHDAIVKQECLSGTGYTGICPTENWFLHKPNGDRYVHDITATSYWAYLPNPGDSEWREFFARRALREMTTIEQNHPAVPTVDGLFIDNLALGWERCLEEKTGGVPPVEYSSSLAYRGAVKEFARIVHSTLNNETYQYPVWANMIFDPNDGTAWNEFDLYLEGGMNESYALHWSNPPSQTSAATRIREMAQAEAWVARGNHFMANALGYNAGEYNMFAFAQYLMITDGIRSSYKYANTYNNYDQYIQLTGSAFPDYDVALGRPTEAKRQVATNVFERCFERGKVTLNLANYSGNIDLSAGCGAASSPTPTPTPRPTPTPTPRPTPTPSASVPPPTGCSYDALHLIGTTGGRIEMENFTCGGQGVAYFDLDLKNNGGRYRAQEAVDVESVRDGARGFNIGWTRSGEWLRYRFTVTATSPKVYALSIRAASPYDSGRFRLIIDGVDTTGLVSVPRTGSFRSYTTIPLPGVSLSPGSHTMELKIEGDAANYNYVELK